MNTSENVKEQYADDKNLSTRIKLHVKYSTNPYGIGAITVPKETGLFISCK